MFTEQIKSLVTPPRHKIFQFILKYKKCLQCENVIMYFVFLFEHDDKFLHLN